MITQYECPPTRERPMCYNLAMPTQFDILKSKLSTYPTGPGCYVFKDKSGEIFYIGKAVNIRNRLKTYFSGSDDRYFVRWLSEILWDIETILVHTEKEALLLEQTLIQKHQPKHNVMLKDDKNFLMLRLKKPDDVTEDLAKRYPKLDIVRKIKKDGAQYFGPYPSAGNIRSTLDLINKHFQLRTCRDQVLKNRTRPCIQHQIGRCLAPCVKVIPKYPEELQNVEDFLKGRKKDLIIRIKNHMWLASQEENFELASKLRDQITAIQNSLESQSVRDAGEKLSADVLALDRSGPTVIVVILKVEKGQVTTLSDFLFEDQPFSNSSILSQFINQYYRNQPIPSLILLPNELGKEDEIIIHSLEEKAQKHIEVSTPKRGRRVNLLDIAHKNASERLKSHLDATEQTDKSVSSLQTLMGLGFKPERIECFDNSLFQGTDAVASQVVFVKGKADKSQYKKYHIKTVEGTDDFAMMGEVVGRRLSGLSRDSGNPSPILILVDGGKGQLSAAMDAAHAHNIPVDINGPLFIAGIAKARTFGGKDEMDHSEERLFLPGKPEPIILERHTLERSLVERIRDEAHRFAITFHRQKRAKRTLHSTLDDVPGIGPKKKKALLKAFGSVNGVKTANKEDIAAVVGTKCADSISDYLGSS